MDGDYGKNEPALPFRHSLSVLTTVVSAAAPGRAVVDAGIKALDLGSGMPGVIAVAAGDSAAAGAALARGDVEWGMFSSGGDEHGILDLGAAGASAAPLGRVGGMVRLVPSHIDPTVNLHDWFVGIRGGIVECVWPIVARGPGR